MGLLRILGLGLLGVLFIVGLTTANLAVAADRTVLNDDFVTDTAAEADLYAVIADELREEALASGPDEDALDDLPIEGVDFETLVNEAITEQWVRSQFEPAIENVFAFLQRDSESLTITIETESLEDNAAETLREEATLDLTALPDDRAAQLDRMTESPEQFADERDEFRSERKAEIQAATDEDLSESELDAALNEQLADNREVIQSQFTEALPPALADAEPAVEALADAWVDAMREELEYAAFADTVETASDEVLDQFVAEFFEETAPFPESIEFTDEDIPAEQRSDIETARDAISAFSLAPFALGGIVLLLAGGMFVLASPGGAMIGIGSLTTLVGGGTAGVTFFVRQELPALVASIPGDVRGPVLTIIDAILDLIFVQSAALAGIGIGAVVIGIVVGRRARASSSPPPATTDTETASRPPEETADPDAAGGDDLTATDDAEQAASADAGQSPDDDTATAEADTETMPEGPDDDPTTEADTEAASEASDDDDMMAEADTEATSEASDDDPTTEADTEPASEGSADDNTTTETDAEATSEASDDDQ